MDSVKSGVVYDDEMMPVIAVSAKCILVLLNENYGSVPAVKPGRPKNSAEKSTCDLVHSVIFFVKEKAGFWARVTEDNLWIAGCGLNGFMPGLKLGTTDTAPRQGC